MSLSNGHVSAFINDGQTYKGYFRGVPRLHPEVRFEWRPRDMSDVDDHLRQVAMRPKDVTITKARFIAQAIKSWSLDEKITTANVAKLRPLLFSKFYTVICGDAPPDDDPEIPEEEAKETQELLEGAAVGN